MTWALILGSVRHIAQECQENGQGMLSQPSARFSVLSTAKRASAIDNAAKTNRSGHNPHLKPNPNKPTPNQSPAPNSALLRS
jgi:hypothetical protein